MTDDPREILKAAGVECAEVTRYVVLPETHTRCADAAILALARLVAGHKWIAEHEGHHIAGEWYLDSRDKEELDFLGDEADHA